jgi:hypothetical protein
MAMQFNECAQNRRHERLLNLARAVKVAKLTGVILNSLNFYRRFSLFRYY